MGETQIQSGTNRMSKTIGKTGHTMGREHFIMLPVMLFIRELSAMAYLGIKISLLPRSKQ